MRRFLGAAAAMALVWASSALWLGASAATQTLHRAEAEAVAVHGFYDHEDLFPVPIFNLSVPYARASYEPGPSTEALGSFLWEREAANLNNIVCALSGNDLCELPDYPFQARATHPSSGGEDPPPTLTIEEEGAPLRVRAAHEEATADEEGARAEADVARLAAIPLTGAQSATVANLAAAMSLATGATQEVSEWLVALRTGSAEAETRAADAAISARGSSVLRGLELLGGLVSVREIRGRAEASTEGSGRGDAAAEIAGVRVGDLRARIGPTGVEIVDERLGGAELAQLTGAVNLALREAGLRLRPGDERVEEGPDRVTAEAVAVSLDFRRQMLPDELPEGTAGDDVLRIPLGWARVEASTAEVATAEPPELSDVAVAPALPPAAIPPDLGSVAPADPAPLASGTDPAPATEAQAMPAAYPVAIGIPPSALAAVVVVALLALFGLTWLKIAEVLAE